MPEPLIFLLILIALPLLLAGWLIRRRYASRLEGVVLIALAGLLALFLLLWGQYPYVGSHYLRYLPLLLTAGATVAVFRAVRDLPWLQRKGWGRGVLMALCSVGALLLAAMDWMALQGRAVDVSSVEMEFPLRGGTWYISTGGSNAVLNLHHKPRTPSQHYAIDVDRLDGLGRYARGLIPDRVEDFLIFGDTIYSPCRGEVIEARDGVPDHAPFEFDADSGGGNQVVIDCDGVEVALLHMMEGSVQVASGDRPAAGDPLGRVGNSGFSVQPHLHVQASRRTGAERASREGVPILFGGRFLVRNDVFAND